MFQLPPHKTPDPQRVGKYIEDYWETARSVLLSDSKYLLEALMNYDRNNVPKEIIDQITPFIAHPDFTPEAVKKASEALGSVATLEA